MKMPLRRKVKRSSRTAAASRQEQVGGDGEQCKSRMKKRTEAKDSASERQELLEEEPETTEDSHAVNEPVEDLCLLEAQSTIERLRRKYLPKAVGDNPDSNTRDIVSVEETEEHGLSLNRNPTPDKSLEYEFRGSQEEVEVRGRDDKENRVTKPKISKQRQAPRPQQIRSRRPRKESLRKASRDEKEAVIDSVHMFKTPSKRPPQSNPSLELKVPTPSLGHSTPSSASKRASQIRPSLFGFEALDSPLTLSPVSASPYVQANSFLRSPESGGVDRPSPYTKMLGTNDIPLRKPLPKKHCGKRKDQPNRSGEIDAWAKALQVEFAEVDEFELAVE